MGRKHTPETIAKMRAAKRLPLDKKKIAYLFNQGVKLKDLAKRFGVCILTIQRRLREMNIRAEGFRRCNRKISEIPLHGCSFPAVCAG